MALYVPYRTLPCKNLAWSITFSSRKHAGSLSSRCYPRKRAAAERSISWMVTQRRCFPPAAQSAVGASLSWLDCSRLARIRASRPREAHSALTPLWIRTHRLQQQSVSHVLVSDAFLCHNTKYPDSFFRAHSARLFAARPDALSVVSDAWGLRPVQRTRRVFRGARPQQQRQSAFARNLLCTHMNPFFSYRETVWICELHSWGCDVVKN